MHVHVRSFLHAQFAANVRGGISTFSKRWIRATLLCRPKPFIKRTEMRTDIDCLQALYASRTCSIRIARAIYHTIYHKGDWDCSYCAVRMNIRLAIKLDFSMEWLNRCYNRWPNDENGWNSEFHASESCIDYTLTNLSYRTWSLLRHSRLLCNVSV